jgi:uncharacterized protein YyaL (SSP411 family)
MTFGPDKNPEVPGHQIVETGLIKLYRITHERKYLELAKHFLDQRGKPELRELYGAYNQDHIPVTEQEEVTGHAVRAVYMYAGMTDIAALYNDSAYFFACTLREVLVRGMKENLSGIIMSFQTLQRIVKHVLLSAAFTGITVYFCLPVIQNTMILLKEHCTTG